MATVTLSESAKLAQDDLVAGVIEDIITVNQMFELLPFDGISGNALAYNRENVMGDVQILGVGGTITAKNPATFTKVTSELTTIIGDAEVNGLIQATRSKETDQEGTQVSSKAKAAGRTYQSMLIVGTGAVEQFDGMLNLCAASQKVATGTNGSNLSFEHLDNLLGLVTAKDGQVDWFMFNNRTITSYKSLLRGLGGTAADDMYELPSGKRVIAYSGVPIFRNDWVPIDQTKGTGTACTTIFAGNFDDGSRKMGLAGLTAEEAAGIQVEDVGIHQSRDERITRVKWYCGLALFSEKALAACPGILN